MVIKLSQGEHDIEARHRILTTIHSNQSPILPDKLYLAHFDTCMTDKAAIDLTVVSHILITL